MQLREYRQCTNTTIGTWQKNSDNHLKGRSSCIFDLGVQNFLAKSFNLPIFKISQAHGVRKPDIWSEKYLIKFTVVQEGASNLIYRARFFCSSTCSFVGFWSRDHWFPAAFVPLLPPLKQLELITNLLFSQDVLQWLKKKFCCKSSGNGQNGNTLRENFLTRILNFCSSLLFTKGAHYLICFIHSYTLETKLPCLTYFAIPFESVWEMWRIYRMSIFSIIKCMKQKVCIFHCYANVCISNIFLKPLWENNSVEVFFKIFFCKGHKCPTYVLYK